MPRPSFADLEIQSSIPLGMLPTEVARRRGKLIRIVIALLALVVCAVVLGVYAVLSDAPAGDKLETVALVLFVAPGFVFVYYAEKLTAYKMLSPQQDKELAELCRDYSDIAAYCDQVSEMGRQPILAEFEACKAHADKLAHKAGK